MELKEFMEKVKNGVCAFLGEDTKVELKAVVKNNGVVLQGMIIIREDAAVAPTIYLDSFFEDYKEGKSLGTIVREICTIYEQNRIKEKINFDFFLDYRAVRTRIFQKIINYEQNKNRLENIPHVRFLDMAVVCYYAYMNDFLGKGSVQIDTSHLDMWGISQEDLFRDARENTMYKLGLEIKRMDEIVGEMLLDNLDGVNPKQIEDVMQGTIQSVPMYVMTLRGRYFGAVCICFEEWLQSFADSIGKNLYILPSSIHELILIPDRGKEEPDFLRNMVQEVNAEHVSAEEILSDNIYYFNRSDKSVSLV